MRNDLFAGARSSLFVGTGCLCLFGVLAVVSIIFGFTQLCAVLSFLFFFCLLSRLWGESALKRVSVHYEGAPAALFPPGDVTLKFHIRNGKLLPVVWLELVQLLEEDAPLFPADETEVCRISGDQARVEGARGGEAAFLHKKFTFVMGGEEITWESRWTARRRGIFRPGRMEVRGGDGFGLTQKERMLDSGERCVAVYPALQPVSVDLFLQDMWEASSGAKGYMEDPTIIKSTRDYARTDPVKRVNWRLTARSQKMVVNTFETILPKSAHFIVDCESFNGPLAKREEFEDMLSILTSVILRLETAGIQCGISLPRGRHTAAREIVGAEKTPLEEILFALAGYELRELVLPEDGDRKPFARPSVFNRSRISALRNVGRFYYLCSSLEQADPAGLIARMEPGRTVLMPYTDPDSCRETALHAFPVVGLRTLKRGAANGT